jgi:hypothetical protein
MRLVKPMMRDDAMNARDALTMANGPRAPQAQPGLTFAQGFQPERPVHTVCTGLRLATRNGQRIGS